MLLVYGLNETHVSHSTCYTITMRARVTHLHLSTRQHDGTFQQYTICVKCHVSLWIDSLEAKPVLCNPDGNGWKLRDNKPKHVLCKQMRPRKKFKISNISIATMKTSQSRTCQCLNAKPTCTELCSCNYCDQCPNRDHPLLLADSSGDDNKIKTELLFSRYTM